jgi:serine/threonine protein kinase
MSIDPLTLCPGCFRLERTKEECAFCGYDAAQPLHPVALAPYTRLREKYCFGRVLGRPGGFGITYLAWDVNLSTVVAIKEYCPSALTGRDSNEVTLRTIRKQDEQAYRHGLDQFVEEARTLAKFRHPNIIGVRDVFRENNTAYMIMEYHDGETLDGYMEKHGGRLALDVALRVLRAVLAGLKIVHAEGMLHRDIKPSNIYITDTERVLLLDFGAARSVQHFDGRTHTALFTPGYSAPEQESLKGLLGPCTDIYAVGATLFTALTGRQLPHVLQRINQTGYEAVRENGQEIPEWLAVILGRCLEFEGYQRYQTVDAFEAALDAAMTNEGIVISGPEPYAQQTTTRGESAAIRSAVFQESDGSGTPPVGSNTAGPSTGKRSTAAEGRGNRSALARRIVLAAAAAAILTIVLIILLPSRGSDDPNAESGEERIALVDGAQPATGRRDRDVSRGEGSAKTAPASTRLKSRRDEGNMPLADAVRRPFPYDRSGFVRQVMQHDLMFDNNDVKESEQGIIEILRSDAATRTKKYGQWRSDIPKLKSFGDEEMETALRELFGL